MNATEPKHNMRKTISMLIVLAIAVATIVYLFITSDNNYSEIILGTNYVAKIPTSASELNIGQIIDTTSGQPFKIKNGFQYKVKVQDLSRDGVDGMSRLNGKVTLISGAIKGDLAVIQITSLSDSIARAEVVELLHRDMLKSFSASARAGASTSQDKIYQATITALGSKGDGKVMLDNKVVYIPNTKIGQKVAFIITSDNGKFAQGKIVESSSKSDADKPSATPINKLFSGTIEAIGSRGDGIVKIDNKVVFIPNTTVGQKINFVITEDKGKFAQGKIVETPQAPLEKSVAKVKVGEEYEVTITQADRYNAENGVTRIGGLVILIPKCKVDDKLKIRISKVAPKYARAIILKKL